MFLPHGFSFLVTNANSANSLHVPVVSSVKQLIEAVERGRKDWFKPEQNRAWKIILRLHLRVK